MKTLLTAFIAAFTFTQSFSQISDFDSVNFDAIDSIAAIYDGYELKDQKKLVGLLTKDLKSDVEKFRAIFKWIANNISYDLDLLDEKNEKEYSLRHNRKKLERWRETFNKKMLKKLDARKSSICQGYSALLQSMSAIAGIRCEIIEGYGRTIDDRIGSGKIDHAWNAVNLNNKWYLCDPTWASGGVDQDSKIFVRRFDNSYFLAEPNFLIANHYPKHSFWTLLYDKPTLKEFLNGPIKTSGFIRNKINRYKPENGIIQLNAPDSIVRFSFTSNLPSSKKHSASVEVSELMGKYYKHKNDSSNRLQQDLEGFWYFDHNFKKGNFKIQIYINRRLSFVYLVNMR